MKFRPRFSLRTLFVLITLISIPLAWVAYNLNWIRQRREFARQHEFNSEELARHYSLNHWALQFPEPPWPLRLFSDPSYTSVYIKYDGSDVKRFKELFPELYDN